MAPYVSPRAIGGVRYPVEGKANPLIAVPAILRAAIRRGAVVSTGTALTGLAPRPGGGFDVATSRARIGPRR